MIDRELRDVIVKWHRSQGGSPTRIAGHAVRLLRECVELCIASGATALEINRAVNAEIYKGLDRRDFRVPPNQPDDLKVADETGDVSLLLSLFADYSSIDVQSVAAQKFQVCLTRQWEADEDGVLWRPGTRGV